MSDINITDYYFKAEHVLLSCTNLSNLSQVKNALNYIKL